MYNGWKNYETWNVALWIDNDAALYEEAREFRRKGYLDLVNRLNELGLYMTPDNVTLSNPLLDIEALDELLEDL